MAQSEASVLLVLIVWMSRYDLIALRQIVIFILPSTRRHNILLILGGDENRSDRLTVELEIEAPAVRVI